MTRRKPGRPRLNADDTTTNVTVRVPTRDFDRACQHERTHRVSVAELLRRGLSRELQRDDED